MLLSQIQHAGNLTPQELEDVKKVIVEAVRKKLPKNQESSYFQGKNDALEDVIEMFK